MVITRQNPKGGPELKSYIIKEDPGTGIYGYPIGYCPCGESLIVSTLHMKDICNKFGWSLEEYEQTRAEIMKKLAPKHPIRNTIIKLLGGRVEEI